MGFDTFMRGAICFLFDGATRPESYSQETILLFRKRFAFKVHEKSAHGSEVFDHFPPMPVLSFLARGAPPPNGTRARRQLAKHDRSDPLARDPGGRACPIPGTGYQTPPPPLPGQKHPCPRPAGRRAGTPSGATAGPSGSSNPPRPPPPRSTLPPPGHSSCKSRSPFPIPDWRLLKQGFGRPWGRKNCALISAIFSPKIETSYT